MPDHNAALDAQPDVRRGLSLAREHCAQCHAIDDASESPVAAAPAFRDLHLEYAVSDLQRPLTQGPWRVGGDHRVARQTISVTVPEPERHASLRQVVVGPQPQTHT